MTYFQSALTAEKEELQLKLAAELAEQLAKQERELKEELETEINNVRGEKRKVILLASPEIEDSTGNITALWRNVTLNEREGCISGLKYNRYHYGHTSGQTNKNI